MEEITMEADVLCIGGGIAGLMAAIRAGELGAKVIVAEKANTLRSGSGATGNDHFRCYIPEFHGPDIEPLVQAAARRSSGPRTANFTRTLLERSFDIVKLWDSWGIPMKHDGKWDFAGHGIPGQAEQLTQLKYSGKNQKPVLTKEAQKRGAEIVNRVTMFELLRDDDGIVGALGMSSRDDKLIIFKAKTIILATGCCSMIYPGPTSAWMFNRCHPPSTTGDGRAMAYRAGAEMVDMEICLRQAGPKYFARCGKGTWIAVIRGPDDKPVGPFVTKPERLYGDAVGDRHTPLFEEYMKSGRGPVYMDTRGISDEDYEYMLWGLSNEGNTSTLNIFKEEGIDLRKNAVEFMTYEPFPRGGILYNEKSETSVKGLYAAGDEYFGGMSNAATFGWIAGENAVNYVKQKKAPELDGVGGHIDEIKDMLSKIRSRKNGAIWQEVNTAIQQTMNDYSGFIKAESQLKAGLTHLLRIKKKAYSNLCASNPHEMMHCLEVLNMIDIDEVMFIAALARKETRGSFVRSDYPFPNPLLDNKVLICKKAGNSPVTEWREIH